MSVTSSPFSSDNTPRRKPSRPTREEYTSAETYASVPHAGDAARSEIVNRTHRVVRDQALDLRRQKQRSRSLWVPVAICSSLLLGILYAAWSMLDGYDLTPNGVPDASDQVVLLLLWSLPLTAAILGFVWFRRTRVNHEVRR